MRDDGLAAVAAVYNLCMYILYIELYSTRQSNAVEQSAASLESAVICGSGNSTHVITSLPPMGYSRANVMKFILNSSADDAQKSAGTYLQHSTNRERDRFIPDK